MKTVGAFEAKTHLSRLLQTVEVHHEDIMITRRKKKVAWLVPYARFESRRRGNTDIVAEFSAIRRKQSKGGISLTDLVKEGRTR